jgi:MoxR-like ATPase
MVERLLLAVLANGHILLEGLPGSSQNTLYQSRCRALSTHSFRVFSLRPDLLPADVIGTMIYNQKDNEFVVKERAQSLPTSFWRMKSTVLPAKVQSALLEAMQERQVTIGDRSYKLDEPFLGSRHPKSYRARRHLSAT